MAMPGDIGRSPGLQTAPVEGDPGQLNDATATSVRGPSNIKRERSEKFREFGLYASKSSSSNPASPIPASLQSPASLSKGPSHFAANNHHDRNHRHDRNNDPARNHHHHDNYEHHDRVVESFATVRPSTSTSHYPTSQTHHNHHQYNDDSSDERPSYDSGHQVQPAPLTPLSPRWDSLAHSHTVLYNQSPQTLPQSKTTVLTLPPTSHLAFNSPGLLTPHEYDTEDDNLLASETRDEFPPLTPSHHAIMNSMESRHVGGDAVVGNFSRPRRPSVKQPLPGHYQTRLVHTTSSATDPTPTDSPTAHHQHLLWPRERAHSNASNKSTATFASLPGRPNHDPTLRETARSRSRQGNPLARPPLAYSRTENTRTRSNSRDAIPRMASMPSGEMRSSYRSQISNSTQQGTMQTERSSVATRSSSIASINGPAVQEDSDEFSVTDIMGMYEKGFRDSVAPPSFFSNHDDSRPPTRASEMSKRKSAMLEAMTDTMPLPRPAALTVSQDALGMHGISHSVSDLSKMPLDPPIRPGTSAGSMRLTRDSAAFFRDPEPPNLLQKEAKEASIFEGEEPETFEAKESERSADSGKHDSGKHVDLTPTVDEDDEDDDEDFPERVSQPERVSLPPKPVANMTPPEGDDESERDRYGFRKHSQYVSGETYDKWNDGYTEYIERRRRKWNAFLKESGLMTDTPNRFPQRSTKTKRFVRKGIPPEWRGAAWFYYAGGPAIVAKHAGVYDGLLKQRAKDVDNEAIERDLHRTFPDNIKFRSAHNSASPNTEAGVARNRNSQATLNTPNSNSAKADETEMISSLRRVLHAFSIYNPRIGYCQSLNFLAGLLLLFVETEEHAFWLLNIITRVYLPGTHEMSLEGANVDLAVLMSSLRDSMPAVWSKIGGELDGTDAVVVKPKSRRHRKGPEPTRLPPITLCMTAWFMSCFIGTLPIETTLRVWDVFFYEGSKTLFRIALAIFKIGENEIKSVSDPMEIFQVVQTIPRRLIDANGLMESCFKRRNGFGHLSQDNIEQRRQERRDNVKVENARIAAGLGEDTGELKKKGTFLSTKK
ncbi:TBC domain-containing protein [Apiospora saccharicola]|uniref:TBC domain-containing protein n=1 Tax=Apiospora saccharicola TaxID=335842 RepID=A0ABR1UX64_9PEZI